MTIYVEYELRCDIGLPDEPYKCEPARFDTDPERLIRQAREDGWKVKATGQHARCPDHQSEATTPST